ncbi:MAG TPA: HDOD domain-containing protein [Syntrophobacter fumaroxidans]|nr:HDOD domain-containing protein [Syntrophobacter fumaroxidans]
MIRELDEFEVKALHYELLLKDIIATAEKLPAFPSTAWQVMSLIKGTGSNEEIERLIKSDPIISSGVLALSQSGHYGRNFAIGSLLDAVLVLKGEKLIEMILAASAARYFAGEISGQEMHHRRLWLHSVATALTGERLARVLNQKKPLTVYTAALLHDVGKTVLDLYAKIYLHASLKQLKQSHSKLIDIEKKALGVNHQELGELIVRRWKFPADVVSAVGSHHTPEAAPYERHIAATVYAANRIVNAFDQDDVADGPFDPDNDPIFQKLGINDIILKQMQNQLEVDMDDMNMFLLT